MPLASNERDERILRQIDIPQGEADQLPRRTGRVQVEGQGALLAQQGRPEFVGVSRREPAVYEPHVVHVRREVAQQPEMLTGLVLRAEEEEHRVHGISAGGIHRDSLS